MQLKEGFYNKVEFDKKEMTRILLTYFDRFYY